MSDYFGALMRSSGVKIGATSHPLPTHRAPSEGTAAPLELDIEHSIAAPAAVTATTRHAPAAVTLASSSPLITTLPTAVAHVADAVEPHEEPEATVTALQASEHVPVRQRELAMPSQPASAHGLVQAALHWVASDPAQTPQSPQLITHSEHASAARLPGREPIAAATESVQAPTRSATRVEHEPPSQVVNVDWEQDPIAIPESAADSIPQSLEDTDEATTAVNTVPARSMPATLVSAAVPMPRFTPRDEVIEVSIGAVHVRVDAPPELAVSRALAPTPASRTATQPQRSGLMRRALRRI